MNFTNIYYLQLAVQRRRDSAPRRRGFNNQTETASIWTGDGVPENRCLEGNTVEEEEGEGRSRATNRQAEERTDWTASSRIAAGEQTNKAEFE